MAGTSTNVAVPVGRERTVPALMAWGRRGHGLIGVHSLLGDVAAQMEGSRAGSSTSTSKRTAPRTKQAGARAAHMAQRPPSLVRSPDTVEGRTWDEDEAAFAEGDYEGRASKTGWISTPTAPGSWPSGGAPSRGQGPRGRVEAASQRKVAWLRSRRPDEKPARNFDFSSTSQATADLRPP